MDLVDDEGVLRKDVAILEPASCDPRRHDHDGPGRRVGCRFALAVDDADSQLGGAEDRFGDRTNGERLPGAGARDDAEALPAARELADLVAMLTLEDGLDVKSERQLDRFARRARGRDDDDAAGRRLGGDE